MAPSKSSPQFTVSSQNQLKQDLPDIVHFSDSETYTRSTSSYWSLNAAEVKPSCVIRPTNTQEVASAVKVLKSLYDKERRQHQQKSQVRFTIRSGGHSPEAGFSTLEDGVVFDLSALNNITISQDKKSVTVGVGARWRDAFLALGEHGLAMAGGRNSDVGVGGLALGGGISAFSPRYGMVCDNIFEYEIVLADGSIIYPTSTQHADLWRSLKGGSGNFGIVTKITARTFPCDKIWSGYMWWASWQMPKAMEIFHEVIKPENHDEFAAAPILAVGYVQKLGIKAAVCNMTYTKPEPWPMVFSGFFSLWWRLWHTMKVQSPNDMAETLVGMSPAGCRQFQVTTTIQNDLETIQAFNDIFNQKVGDAKTATGMICSLVFQDLSQMIIRKGEPNVLGLESRPEGTVLIIVLISVSWNKSEHDELVHRVSREMISLGEEFAAKKGTLDRYRYLNYAASLQDPFSGYGEENIAFMQKTSRKYDPTGFFQIAKQGGFKLGMYDT